MSSKSDGANLKSWATGSLSLADGYVGGANTQLVEQYGYNGYMFGAVPESKQLTVTLEVVGKYIDSIIVYGDRTANQFPTKAYRDGNPNDIIYSDDPVWAIRFGQQSTSHTITFLEWNRADYNACITYFAELKNELTLDKSWIKSLESLSQSTGQSKDIHYGVIASSGNIDVLDVDGEIRDYLQDGIMANNNLPVIIKANGKEVQSHILKDADYYISGNSKIFNSSLYNKLSLWSSIEFNGYDNKVEEIDAYTLLVWLIKTYYSDDDTLFENMFNGKVSKYSNGGEIVGIKEYMQSVIIPNPYLEKSSLLDAVNKICQICQLWIYEDDNGNIKIESARPRIFENKDIIFIPKSRTYNLSSDVIIKNRYDGTKLFKNELIRSKDKDALFTLSGFYVYDKNKQLILNKSDKVYLDAGYSHYVAMNNNRMVKIDNYEITDLKFPNFANQISDLEFEVTKTFIDGSSYTYNLPRFGIDISMAIDYTDMVDAKFQNNKLIMDFQITAHDPNESNLIINTQYMYSFSIRIVGYTKSSSYIEYSTGYNRFELPQNELLQTQDLVNGINSNVVSDYIGGIHTASITVSCLDYYDSNNKIVKVWQNGEIISVGDFVKVQGLSDNEGEIITWRVVSRKFRYSGCPFVDLELQEIKTL
jgi:hypothetical protein